MSPARTPVLVATVITVLVAGCGSTATSQGGPMMGGGYHYPASTCRPPAGPPGRTVRVSLTDMGMSSMMGGDAPSGVVMRLTATPASLPAGRVMLVVLNQGWRTHELVVLPLADGDVGRRDPDPDGKVDERASLGEASASCAAGAGEGITSGSTGWTTLTLAPGRYELICNLKNHYADGMRRELDVS